jgi:hypothetical protein
MGENALNISIKMKKQVIPITQLTAHDKFLLLFLKWTFGGYE